MRPKPQVPETSDALARKLRAVEEMIEEDRAERAGEQTPPAVPAPAPVPVTPVTEQAYIPTLAEYSSLRGRVLLPTRQLNIKIPLELYEEVWLLAGSTPGESMTSITIAALRREIESRKGKGNAVDQ